MYNVRTLSQIADFPIRSYIMTMMIMHQSHYGNSILIRSYRYTASTSIIECVPIRCSHPLSSNGLRPMKYRLSDFVTPPKLLNTVWASSAPRMVVIRSMSIL